MDYWIVQDSKVMRDRRHGGSMTRITFLNIKTLQTADTYICPGLRNSRNWYTVIGLLDQGMIIGNLGVVVSGNRTVISADSEPVIHWRGTPAALSEELARHWNKNNQSRFSDSVD